MVCGGDSAVKEAGGRRGISAESSRLSSRSNRRLSRGAYRRSAAAGDQPHDQGDDHPYDHHQHHHRKQHPHPAERHRLALDRRRGRPLDGAAENRHVAAGLRSILEPDRSPEDRDIALHAAFDHHAPAEHGDVAVHSATHINRAVEAGDIARGLPFLDGDVVAELHTVFVGLLGKCGGGEGERQDESGYCNAHKYARSGWHEVSHNKLSSGVPYPWPVLPRVGYSKSPPFSASPSIRRLANEGFRSSLA